MNFNNRENDSEFVSKYKPAPAKTHPGRLIGIYDIGKQPGFKEDDDPKNQLVLVYELLGKDKQESGENFHAVEYVTKSLHVKATLGKRLKALGAPIRQKNENWFDLPKDYAIEDLLGNACMVTTDVSTSGRTKVTGVSSPVDGLDIPVAQSGVGFLDLDADDWESQLNAAPDWVRKKYFDRIKD